MANSVAFTRLKDGKSSHVFVWLLENFDATFPVEKTNANPIDSSVFNVTLRDESVSKWFPKLGATGGAVTCELYLKSCNSEDFPRDGILIAFEVNFSCEGSTDYFYGKKSEGSKRLKISDHWGWPDFITLKELHNGRDVKTLRVKVTLNVFEDSFQQSTPAFGYGKSLGTDSAFTFESLLLDSTFSDVVIQCGTETFKAHRAILAGRSEVFKAMLRANMRESTSGRIQIDDVEPKVLQVILRYIYTGKVEETDSAVLLSVIYGAEKYDLESLKQYCLSELMQCFTNENVGPLAVAADLCGAEESLRQVLKSYMEPRFYILMKNPDFRDLVGKHPTSFY